jgi:hypothetical protein
MTEERIKELRDTASWLRADWKTNEHGKDLDEALDEIEKLRGLLEETVASVVLDAARSRDTGDTVSAVECEDIAMRIRNALRGVK